MSSEDAPPARRRERRRAGAPQGPPRTPAPSAPAPVVAEAPPEPPAPEIAAAAPRRSRDGRAKGGPGDHSGAGRSQVSLSAALRARDVNRPTAADLAAAERDTQVVRRNWQPDAAEKPRRVR